VTKVVGELRDYGVKRAMTLDGKRMTEADETHFHKTFDKSLSKAQRDLLVKWWKSNVEGAA